MLAGRSLAAAVMHSSDRWDHYWEGTLRRTNDNIGTLLTRTTSVVVGYGVTNRLTIVGMLPYVTTRASQGTLRSLSGVQDFQAAIKYRLLNMSVGDRVAFRTMVVAGGAAPASDYTPDFLPLSIGLASRRFTSRLTVAAEDASGLFLDITAGHTWRGNVRLDRSSYYTNGQLYLTNEVQMPRVADYAVTAGMQTGRLCLPITLSSQHTLGGGDIRRQDMPFVSNRMDFTRIDGAIMYGITKPRDLMLQLGLGHTLTGRNVGQSTTFTTGLRYMVHI